ncbi:hypothetical protein B0H17DRAFT_1194015 [Mycena rosella]|uniref:Uncharacterized protein n=1 Tax=Mycena rosella TaxID=1033263 RepID=A0AAD7M6W7_MYCRO|nr:hypothetical protein B0H17DRAFT_1194015 [Mycena rosella]
MSASERQKEIFWPPENDSGAPRQNVWNGSESERPGGLGQPQGTIASIKLASSASAAQVTPWTPCIALELDDRKPKFQDKQWEMVYGTADMTVYDGLSSIEPSLTTALAKLVNRLRVRNWKATNSKEQCLRGDVGSNTSVGRSGNRFCGHGGYVIGLSAPSSSSMSMSDSENGLPSPRADEVALDKPKFCGTIAEARYQCREARARKPQQSGCWGGRCRWRPEAKGTHLRPRVAASPSDGSAAPVRMLHDLQALSRAPLWCLWDGALLLSLLSTPPSPFWHSTLSGLTASVSLNSTTTAPGSANALVRPITDFPTPSVTK